MGCPTSLADSRSRFQKGDLSAGETSIVDEFVADRAAGPSATEQRGVSIEPLLADFAMSRFDREQHRLPLSAAFSNTHVAGV